MIDQSLDMRLQAVIRGSRAILDKKSFPAAARAIFDQCCELTGARSGYVALLSENGEENEVLFLEAGKLPCTVDPELPMPIRGLREIAYKTHQPVYDNDFMNSEWVRFMPEGHVTLHNVLFSPLNIEGMTVGIMGLANKPAKFTKADAEWAALFGELAAIALQNSRYLDLLNEKNRSLESALADVKTLRGLLPICCSCKKIRDDEGYWKTLETYIGEHSTASFTHTYCDDCLQQAYKSLDETE